MKIVVVHVCPPIPIRDYDWVAHLENDDEPPRVEGWGRSADQAVFNLMQQLAENSDDPR